jgi:uncharacterized membrane protein YbhN (UPF0104 family)
MQIISLLKNKPILQFFVFFGFTCFLFVVIFHFIDPVSVYNVILKADLKYISLALLIVITYPTLIALRWKYLLRFMHYEVSFVHCIKIILGTWPIMSITPLKSGDLLKGFYLRDIVPLPKAVGSVMAEKFLDLLSLILLSIVGSIILRQNNTLLISFGTLFILIIVVIIINYINVPLNKYWRDKTEIFLSSIDILLTNPKKFLGMILVSIVKWLFVAWQADLCFKAFGSQVPFIYTLSALPIAIFVGLLPISISGMGTRDAAIVYFFSRFASSDICLSVGFLYSFFGYWLLSIIGLLFLHKGFK